MFRSLILATSILMSVGAMASNSSSLVKDINNQLFSEDQSRGLNWTVGDVANYDLNIGGFIKGTMVFSVKAINGSEATLSQNVDLMGQKQSCETVIDTANGQVKSIVCDGKPQDPGAAGDIEVVETKEDNVTVPAGTFVCLYVKAVEKKDNKTIEQWVNPKLVPISGLIKAIMPSQLGALNLALTSFKKM